MDRKYKGRAEYTMKILVIHNFHRKGSASGDDQVFKNETRLLEKYGNSVIKYTVSNDSFDKSGPFGKIKAVFGMLWSFKNYKAVKELIKTRKPDIVHVHTFFPLLSPSVLYAAKKSGCQVVATLHDTRFICPCATSMRGTHLCNKCSDGHYSRMFKYGCFKESRLQSLAVAIIFKCHRICRSFYNQIDKYICLNDKQIELLIKTGFDRNKIVKKYNFVQDTADIVKNNRNYGLPERYVVFYGRIGKEKGINVLIKIWDRIPNIPLVVMGAGPLENEFKKWADKKENIFYLGYTPHNECLSIVRDGEFTVFPSVWYEGCSMVEIESESLGKGIVATDLGFSAEAIQNGVNGYKVKPGDINGFIKIIRKIWDNPEECKKLGENARKDYEVKYTPKKNYEQLKNIYQLFKQ